MTFRRTDNPAVLEPADAPTTDASSGDTLAAAQGRSLRQIVFSRLRRDKVAMVALIILTIVYLLAIFGPFIAPLFGLDPFARCRSCVATAAGGPVLPFGGIELSHPLGVEWGTGRDIASQLLWGLRISLIVATSATFLVVSVGTILGIIAGYAGGWTDMLLGRFMDLILAFPTLLILIAMSPVLTQRITDLGVPPGNPSRIVYLILAISAFGWPYLARIVRGQVLSLREREFVEAAVAAGASRRRILFTEILPNLWAPILVYTTLALPAFIGLEAALSFLGVGVLPPDVTFGAMLANSVRYFERVPTYLFIPGISLVVIVVAFNLLGDSLRDALDPRATH
jgi:peptide/nickel transport system permease protein